MTAEGCGAGLGAGVAARAPAVAESIAAAAAMHANLVKSVTRQNRERMAARSAGDDDL